MSSCFGVCLKFSRIKQFKTLSQCLPLRVAIITSARHRWGGSECGWKGHWGCHYNAGLLSL